MSIRWKVSFAAAVVCALMATGVRADWSDSFDSYTPGSIDAQGPWVDFGGDVTSDVSTVQAHSGTQSLALSTETVVEDPAVNSYGSDVFVTNMDSSGVVSSGQWNLSYWLYTPADFDGVTFMYLSEGPMEPGAYVFKEGVNLQSDSRADTDPPQFKYPFEGGVSETPLVVDQWAKVELLIDLDADTVNASYNGVSFHSGVWDRDPADEVGPSIGGLNFWATDGVMAGTTYIDDISLTAVPEPSTVVMLLGLGVFGAIALVRRGRK